MGDLGVGHVRVGNFRHNAALTPIPLLFATFVSKQMLLEMFAFTPAEYCWKNDCYFDFFGLLKVVRPRCTGEVDNRNISIGSGQWNAPRVHCRLDTSSSSSCRAH